MAWKNNSEIIRNYEELVIGTGLENPYGSRVGELLHDYRYPYCPPYTFVVVVVVVIAVAISVAALHCTVVVAIAASLSLSSLSPHRRCCRRRYRHIAIAVVIAIVASPSPLPLWLSGEQSVAGKWRGWGSMRGSGFAGDTNNGGLLAGVLPGKL
ncbi:hypothetical protein EDB84DRAFT_1616691 [Lactarius hengduanensis]|nr:hypothetical protein EDB84DRAFT_1616691 [Lactarius hengduanensis]